MAAIISDKFRIFNAKQVLESLSEGATDTSADDLGCTSLWEDHNRGKHI